MGQYKTRIGLGAPIDLSDDEWERVDEHGIYLRTDERGEIVFVPLTLPDDGWDAWEAVPIDELATRYADRIVAAREAWQTLAAALSTIGVVLPDPRLYLATIEVA